LYAFEAPVAHACLFVQVLQLASPIAAESAVDLRQETKREQEEEEKK